MNLTHPQNVLKKREKVNMSDDLEIVPKKALHKMLEMADRIEQLEAALKHIWAFYPISGLILARR
jgi:hypothetical protein